MTDRAEFEALILRELDGKCPTCCPVIGCRSCGFCPTHDEDEPEGAP